MDRLAYRLLVASVPMDLVPDQYSTIKNRTKEQHENFEFQSICEQSYVRNPVNSIPGIDETLQIKQPITSPLSFSPNYSATNVWKNYANEYKLNVTDLIIEFNVDAIFIE